MDSRAAIRVWTAAVMVAGGLMAGGDTMVGGRGGGPVGAAWGQEVRSSPSERPGAGPGGSASSGPGGGTAHSGGEPAPPAGPGGGGPSGRLGLFQREGGPERLTEEERNRFRVFANAYMPNTAAAAEELPLPRQRQWMSGTALFHYRRYERGRRDFPELEERFLQDARDVDEVVRLAREFAGAPAERQSEIRGEIRRRLISVSRSILEERRQRIERLREQLEREAAALERDEAMIEQGLEQRAEEFLRLGVGGPDGGEGPGRRTPPPRGPGGRGGAPGAGPRR